MNPRIEGRDLQGQALWQAEQISADVWLATGRDHLLTRHLSDRDVIGFFLEWFPGTSTIRYESSDHFGIYEVSKAQREQTVAAIAAKILP